VGYGLDYRWFESLQGLGNFSLRLRVQTASGTHLASYQIGIRGSIPGVKRSGYEADHSPPSSAKVKECVELFHSPSKPSWRGLHCRNEQRILRAFCLNVKLYHISLNYSFHISSSYLNKVKLSLCLIKHQATKERAPGTHWIGVWVGPRSVLVAVVKRKIPSPRRESNPRTSIIQPVA
jgi:hypothetical protein